MQNPPQPVTSIAVWRRMPIFVASTFRDMDYERDVIHRVVVPRVNERLRASGRNVEVYAVDLRWGIETDDRLDAATRQRTILATCAAEIARCRPLFLGLVGNAYGWVPPEPVVDDVLAGAGVTHPGFALSVTAIEILSAMRAGAADGVPPIVLSRSVPRGDLEAAVAGGIPVDASPVGLGNLMGHLTRRGVRPEVYEARWDGRRGRLESDSFAAVAEAVLMRTLDGVLAAESAPTWLDAELSAQRAAAARSAEHFVGRAEELESVGEFWDFYRTVGRGDLGDDLKHPLWKMRRHMCGETMLAIVGASGSGKSALLAQAATNLTVKGVDDESQIAGYDLSGPRAYVQVGATARSERLPMALLVLLAQLDHPAAQRIADRVGPDALRLDDVLGPWLATLARFPVSVCAPLIIVDGLDRFRAALTEVMPLTWLPTGLGDRVRLLVSAVDDTFEAVALEKRPSTHVLRLGDLTAEDARALVVGRAAAHHKAIPRSVVEALVTRSTSPRWLVVASTLLLTLMAHDYLVLRRADVGTDDPERALRRVIEEIAADLPAGLGEIHEEAYWRMAELVDDWFGVLLCALHASFFGLREQDLHAVLDAIGRPHPSADLALARALLAEHVSVVDGIWQFAHTTARAGADHFVAAVSESVDRDILGLYQQELAAYATRLPVDDPVRVRELLPLLFDLEAFPTLARMLATEDESCEEAVAVLGLMLSATAHGGESLGTFTQLLAAGENETERLTLAHLIVLTALPAISGKDATSLAEACRAAIDAASPRARSRHGLTPSDVRVALEAVTFDPLDTTDTWVRRVTDWSREASTDGYSLRDAPWRDAPVTDVQAGRALMSDLHLVTEAAIVAATPPRSPADQADVAAARERLRRWRGYVDRTRLHEDPVRELFDLVVAVAERAAHAAWPGEGFSATAADWVRIRALADRMRAPDVIALLGQCARVHAVELIGPVDLEADSMSDADAARVDGALRLLEEAMWHLSLQRTLTPHSLAVEGQAILCGLMHSDILRACDQHASACRSGIDAASSPKALEILGWETYRDLAGDSLASLLDADTNVDPRRVIEVLVRELDRRATPDGLPSDEDAPLEALLFGVSLEATAGFADFHLGRTMVNRALRLYRAGVFPEDADVLGYLRESLAEVEDDLAQVFADLDPDADLDELAGEGVAEFGDLVDWVRDSRLAVAEVAPEPADLVGAAFAATLGALILQDPQRRSLAQSLRRLVDPRRLVEARETRLLDGTDALLDFGR